MTETIKQYQKRMEIQDREDWVSLLKVPWGQRIIWNLMSKCGIFAQSFVPESPESTAFNEGRRSIGNTLLRQVVDIKPEAYLQMVKRSKKEEDYARQCRSEQPESDE